MQTEKKLREAEELRTVEDYMYEYQKICGLASELSGAGNDTILHIENILNTLSKALDKKYKYMVSRSKKWTRRQGLFSKIRDTMIERQEAKRLKQELENERILSQIEALRNKVKKKDENIASSQPGKEDTEVVETVEHSDTEVLTEGDNPSLLEF